MSIQPLRIVSILAVAAGACGFGVPAQAQYAHSQSYYTPGGQVIEGHIMGGYSATSGVTADYLQGGWMIDGGATWWPKGGNLGLRADLGYSGHSATNQFIDSGEQATGLAVDYGNGGFASLSLGPVLRTHLSGTTQLYGLAQLGVTHVRLRLAQTFYVPDYYYCDPFFGYCDGGYDTGDFSVYSYGTTRMSWNVGVGLEFPSPWGSRWFIEAQYRRVQTEQPMEYWPIMVGLRF